MLFSLLPPRAAKEARRLVSVTISGTKLGNGIVVSSKSSSVHQLVHLGQLVPGRERGLLAVAQANVRPLQGLAPAAER